MCELPKLAAHRCVEPLWSELSTETYTGRLRDTAQLREVAHRCNVYDELVKALSAAFPVLVVHKESVVAGYVAEKVHRALSLAEGHKLLHTSNGAAKTNAQPEATDERR